MIVHGVHQHRQEPLVVEKVINFDRNRLHSNGAALRLTGGGARDLRRPGGSLGPVVGLP